MRKRMAVAPIGKKINKKRLPVSHAKKKKLQYTKTKLNYLSHLQINFMQPKLTKE